MVYLHDGTFNGLLTCIYEHYYTKKVSGIYCEDIYEMELLEEELYIPTDDVKAKKVYYAIWNKISDEAMMNVYYTFLSNDYRKDYYILKYLELGFKMGYKIDNDHTNKDVINVHKLSTQVSKERHRLLGILRFQEVGHGLYAPVTPDNDVIELLAEHFVDRLKNEQFIIHDKKRKKAVIYNKKEWIVADFDLQEEILISKKEKKFQEMWKGYFEHISIKERKNLRLQRQFVPTRYRKNMVEFNNNH
jgi:probable DNA metabolism protein